MPVTQLILTALLALSLYGYIQYFSQKLTSEFAIGFTFASIGSIMFICGIFGLLAPAAYAITAGGLVPAVLSVKDFKDNIRRTVSPGTVFFIAICCVLTCTLLGSQFTHYDNFSHWAFASRTLIQFDRFPNLEDKFIAFQSYPTGTASFIYFFCKICGADSEWFQALMNSVLLAGMFCSIFAFAKSKKNIAVCSLAVFALMCSNTDFADLLVDTTLSAVGFGLIAMCIYYRNNLKDKILYTIPYMCFLISVKNSGIFFVVLAVIYMLVYIPKSKLPIIKWVTASLCPFITLMLWQQHVNATFENGLTARHSMSITYFVQVLADKSREGIVQTFKSLFNATFTLNNPLVILLALSIVIFILKRCGIIDFGNIFRHTFVFSVIAYLAYQLGMFGMYVLAMPGDYAAIYLAGYERYHPTIITFIVAVMTIGLMSVKIKTPLKPFAEKLLSAAMSAIIAFSVFCAARPNLSYYIPQRYRETTFRDTINETISQHNLQPNMRYLIVCEESFNTGHYLYMCRFLLNPSKSYEVTIEDVKNDEARLSRYDYIMIFDRTEETLDYLSKFFGDDIPYAVYIPDYNLSFE